MSEQQKDDVIYIKDQNEVDNTDENLSEEEEEGYP